MSEQDRRGDDSRTSIKSEADAPKASVETGEGDESNVPADAFTSTLSIAAAVTAEIGTSITP